LFRREFFTPLKSKIERLRARESESQSKRKCERERARARDAHASRSAVWSHLTLISRTSKPLYPTSPALSHPSSTSGACRHRRSSFITVTFFHNGNTHAHRRNSSSGLSLSGGNTEVSTVLLQMEMQHWKEDRSIEGVKQLKHTLRQILKSQCLAYLLHKVTMQRTCAKWLPVACYREREHINKKRRTFEKGLPALE
jgi:hypothetical protein